MPEEPYTKREEDAFRGDITKHLEKQDVILNQIKEQTTKTNGRVSAIEDWAGQAKKIIEKLSDDSVDLKTDRKVIYTLLVVVPLIFGALGYFALRSFVSDSFFQLAEQYNIKVQ